MAGSKSSQPNIVFIMADDIGWFNVGAYNQGIMATRTPNLDRLAAEGMRFTDYYAEASCTAGRANFITGQIPLRTGLTTVGQAGAKIGMPAEAPTIATALRVMGYSTGQFGNNHLGDLNEYLPTLHGFDEFFGYLYPYNWFVDQFWRFVLVQEVVAKAAETLIEFPPMQKGASFNMEAVKEQIAKAMASHSGS
jgi:arylsulfatase A-like enzyme